MQIDIFPMTTDETAAVYGQQKKKMRLPLVLPHFLYANRFPLRLKKLRFSAGHSKTESGPSFGVSDLRTRPNTVASKDEIALVKLAQGYANKGDRVKSD